MRALIVVRFVATVLVCGALAAAPRAQTAQSRTQYDTVLDLFVRDGLVYYRALKAERAKLDAFVTSLADAPANSLSPNDQLAFWLNAYNAIVLRTVIDHYPIAARTSQYPAHSLRQVPGAFESLTHRVAGRSLTLDQIEQSVLAGFKDPRVYLALGRASIGGGRLRSEAFDGGRIDAQLKEVADECVTRTQCVDIERDQNKVLASAIFSWRSKDFIASYAGASKSYAERSPIERAILAFVDPRLLGTEREFLEKDQFQVAFRPYDWTLNDLTGRGGR